MYAKNVFLSFIQVAIKAGAPSVNMLNDGVSVDYINSIFEKIERRPTSQIIDLYSWRNGINLTDTATISEVMFGVSGIFTTVEQSIDEYIYICKSKLVEGDYFPVFADDYHLVTFNNLDERVFIYSPEEFIFKPVPIYDSIKMMFITLVGAHLENIVSYSTGEFECNYEKYIEIAAKINKNSTYWNTP